MSSITKRIWLSLAIFAAWIAITMYGARLITGGDTTLDKLVSTQIGWQFVIAIVLLLSAIVVFRWNDIQFTKPHSLVRVMWFPVIYLAIYAGLVIYLGVPPLSVVIFVTINTLMVGISEELMFRGVLFRALDKAMSIWPAIILTSILFGAVHALNGFITGNFDAAILQSIAAIMSGIVFMAILIRTGSIWPAIIYHFLWDCLIFLAGSGAHTSAPELAAQEPGTITMFVPILLNLPNLIVALILLRNVGKQSYAV